ncbi:MAG TPA: glycosyltransferase family 1 protein [Solirubrobacteraceae bacterium]|jgi:glycosyltransferase involved in cell wall biosynthesis
MKSLTIGIDARSATEVSAGRGRVTRELLRALAVREHDDNNRYILYSRQQWTDPALDGALDGRFRWRLSEARNPFWHLLAARAASRECDVFLSANSYLTTWFASIPSVPIVFDMVTFEPAMRPNRVSAVIERIALPPAVRRASGFLAISQATADALTRRFPAAAGRTTVAPLGVTPALSADLDGEELATLPPPGFVLSVGTLEPRKNLPRLVAAYRELDSDLRRSHPLVVVGALGWQTGETLEALRSLGDDCVMLGRVSDAALAELYRRCAVFCYPSLGEGFGLPVLEAMAAGAAVLTSSTSSLPEVGGEAVAYADPYDVQGISRQLEALLRSPERRAQLGALGCERAEEFSWERFAEITLEALDRTVARESRQPAPAASA